MAETVRRAKFRTTRLRPGYDEQQVDAFLDEIVAALNGGRLDPAVTRAAVFGTTRPRPGYVQQDVDDLLAKVARYGEDAAR